ncbi:MAG TPA: fatty acid desaturase [Tepidisphaeraceae bacterium]|nr:fatty acid desaturase [Tepidisphaeraceae bacterium]
MSLNAILPKKGGLFRYSAWDAVPVAMAVVHLLYIGAMYAAFTYLLIPLAAKIALMFVMGIIYSFSISWNINGISHNFIHNRYFNSAFLNRIFSLLESVDCCFSQILYDYIHRRHHMGNSDKPQDGKDTIDWISIYRHGHDGHAENVWTFTFLSFFREDPKAAYREVKKNSVTEAHWAIVEMALVGVMMLTFFILNWRFLLFFLPCWYFGHCLSYLNGYFEHFGGNPDVPMAWGVSSYHRLYNWVWFNNGFHAEHHYRPRAHWTRMRTLRDAIVEDQKRVGVRVIKPPHAFGFLDPDLCDEPLVPAKKSTTEDAPPENDLVDLTKSQ